VEPGYDLSQADIIVSLDADFLFDGPANLSLTRAFSQKRRDPAAGFNRLYVVESAPSITGAKADVRWRHKPSEVLDFTRQLAAELLQGVRAESPEVRQLADDLRQHRGRSVIMAGDYQPEMVHALAFQLNQVLGNIGTTVTYREAPPPPVAPLPLLDFIAALKRGAAGTLLIAGVNPIYDLPSALDFSEALARVPNSIHLGLYDDETGSRCQWHVPESHYLEAWGDILARHGTPSLIQPVIEPLYPDVVSLLEVISLLVDLPPKKGYDIVHDLWQRNLTAGRPTAWEESLKQGVVMGSSSQSLPPGPPSSRFFFGPTRRLMTGALPIMHGFRNCRVR
jgi:molybdopterin-containing oxidoreductase family iron-sulfur binding subunit